MKRLRITGLVGLAHRVRQELASPMSPVGLDRLKFQVARGLGVVGRMMLETGLTAQHLPPPSRKAYEFLAGLDFDKLAAAGQAGLPLFAQPAPRRPVGSITFPSLRSSLDWALAELAKPPAGAAGDGNHAAIHAKLAQWSGGLEDLILRDGIEPAHIKPSARELRGWLAYFSRPENFARYMQAMARARAAFDSALASGKFRPPWTIHFRPSGGLFNLRGRPDGTIVKLPTPMISFTDADFAALAAMVRRQPAARRRVIELVRGEAYQAIMLELELLAGVVEQARGIYHDLAESFARVNREYFASAMPRPRLVWSRGLTCRKFGHYDYVRDTVMVSATLDRPDVPACVVDSVMHHELLHKQGGVQWVNDRQSAHNSDFARQERQFAQYQQAQAVLERLARR